MHDHGVMHGDLKGVCANSIVILPHHNLPGRQANILVDKDGHARLADFCLLVVVPDQPTVTSTFIEGGSIPWMSPELLDPESFGLKKSRPTRESDCYALGEVLSGKRPFFLRNGPIVMVDILNDERPGRPEGGEPFTDTIWGVLELCWKRQPSARASVRAVLRSLGGTPERPDPLADEDVEVCTDDELDATAHNPSTFSPFHLET